MKLKQKLLAASVLAALSSPAFAEIEFDVIGGSEISFEGLVQADGNWFDNDVRNLNSSLTDGSDSDFEMRRAELVLKGKGPGMWSWVVGYDAKADKFLDVNVQYKFNGFTTLTVGQFKQPNSLEELSSTKNNDFISKAMTTNLQGVARRLGVQVSTGGDNWGIAGSLFDRELTRRQSPSLGSGRGFGLRGYFAPINESGHFLHLGASFIDMEAKDFLLGDGALRLRVRPDADLSGQRLIDTGQFLDADRVRTIGAEAAYVHGPVKVQAEYMTSDVSRDVNADFTGSSWYIYGVWNITGESWGYKNGVVTTGLPNEPASGMWQLGLRYDHADLNDGSVNFANPNAPVVSGVMGGKESNWTVGVNWYWRSNFKFALNYVKVDSERYSSTAKDFVQDDPSIVEFRAQLYW